jgi:hypothetical protein
MGIQKEPAAFIAQLARTALPSGFSVCELGDQGMCGEGKNNPARPWYESIGCGRYVSIDGNGRGTLTADLNQGIADMGLSELRPRFDLVTDFGTGEHIFDQAQVWRTIHDLTKPRGYIAFDRPAQGYQKHCYYLTNDCLYVDIAAANGYGVVWFARAATPRGQLIRGAFRTPSVSRSFVVPQQGRYLKDLVIAR